jgi:hypothetical protein
MIRASEYALSKERNNLKKTKTKKDDRYKLLINQVCFDFDLEKKKIIEKFSF